MQESKPRPSAWALEVLPIAVTFGIDRVTKLLALRQGLPDGLGPLSFEVHLNGGIAFGYFSGLPSPLKYSVLASLGAFVVSAYIFSRFFLRTQSRCLRLGLALQVSGIASNGLDRLLGDGSVIDFISFSLGAYRSPVWNLADNFQLLGYALVLLGMAHELRSSWTGVEQRGASTVNPAFETKATWIVACLGAAAGGITATMSYAFFRAALASAGVAAHDLSAYSASFLFTLAVLQLANLLVCLVIGKFLAARIAGPLYALRVYLRSAVDSDEARAFRLRQDDEFKELEAPVSELAAKYSALRRAVKKDEAA